MSKMKNKKREERRDRMGSGFAASVPLIGFLLFSMIPLLLATVISFTELHNTDLSNMEFVGLKNYKTILTNGDGYTYDTYLNTFIFAMSAPLCIGVSLYIANLINKTRIGQRLFRSIFFVPYVCSTVVISMTFHMLYQEELGVFNSILTHLGFERVGWLVDSPMSFLGSAIFMAVWQGVGWSTVLYQAALAQVDQTYYEAARIDGATSFQMFWKITWPAISPTTFYLFTMKIIWALQSMAETMVLAENNSIVPEWRDGGAWASDLVVKHIYNMVFEKSYQFGYGVAAAAGWILAILVFLITRLVLRAQRRWANYDF